MSLFTRPFIIADTEYTAWEGSVARGWSGPGEHREIVQIAAIKVEPQPDADMSLIEVESFDVFIKPEINPELSDYFKNLTGISQHEVDEKGGSFKDGLMSFLNFCGDMPVWSYGRDDDRLRENADLYELGVSVPNFHDVRDVVKKAGFNPADYSSGTLYKAVGENLQGHTHNALFDCRSILAFLKTLSR